MAYAIVDRGMRQVRIRVVGVLDDKEDKKTESCGPERSRVESEYP